jgi:hypothetical protein
VYLHAVAALGTATSNVLIRGPAARVLADIPLRLRVATSADQLNLELNADRQKWCLHATDASGGRPIEPLFVRLTASATGGLMSSGIPGGTGDAWAQRWLQGGSPSMFQSTTPVTVTVWVGGPNYVTARAETTVSGSP